MAVAGGFGALLGTFLGTGTAATIAKVALAAGAIALQILLAPRPKQPRPDDLRTTKQSEEGPGRWAIGRVELEGQVLFGRTKGYDLYQVIMHAFGPIDGIEEYFWDGVPIVVDPGGDVSSPPFARPGGSYLNLRTRIGSGNDAVWGDLVTAFTAYTNDHRIRGIAQTRLKALNPGTTDDKFGRLYQGGLKPVRLLARISLFSHPWDPRLNAGSGGRQWTLNAVLIAAHIRSLLPGASFSSIDWDDMATRATEAEATVNVLGGGTAPRAQLSGGGEGPLTVDVMIDFLESAGLEEVFAPDGKIRFAWLEDYPDAELHLTSDHILSVTVQRGPEGVRRPNVCRVKYLSPERQYTIAELPIQTFGGTAGAYDGPAWARVQDEIDAYGEQEITIELPFCPDASQAQRLARRRFWMERADRLEVITSFAGLAAYGRRTLDIDIPDVGTDGATLTVRARLDGWAMDDAAGQCRLICRIIPDILEDAWNPATDEVEAPPEFVPAEEDVDLDTPAAPTAAIDVQMPDSSRQMRIRYAGVTDADISEANYRGYTGGEPDLWQGMTEVGLDTAYVVGDFRGDQLDFRVRMFDADENGSLFSDLLEEDSLATDSTAPSPPTDLAYEVDGDGNVLNVTCKAPSSLQVVKIEIREGQVYGTSTLVESFAVLPYQEVTTTLMDTPDPGQTLTYFAVAFATGDVASTVASVSYARAGGGA